MGTDVHKICRACLQCLSRNPGFKTKPPLVPIPVPGRPFERIAIDFLQMPMSQNGNRYALVFVDYLSKWPEVFAVPDQTATTAAKYFVEKIVARHGVPHELISDQGSAFVSDLMLEICKLLGTKKINTAAHHQQADGLCERFNHTLLDMLAKLCQDCDRDWEQYLPFALFHYWVSPQA